MVSLAAAPERAQTTRRILSAFDLHPGEMISGVAAGGSFIASPSGAVLDSYDPTTGEVLARVRTASSDDVEHAASAVRSAFERWRLVPAPRRGEIVRLLGDAFRRRKEDLAQLISL